jgi:hypothetical protein
MLKRPDYFLYILGEGGQGALLSGFIAGNQILNGHPQGLGDTKGSLHRGGIAVDPQIAVQV